MVAVGQPGVLCERKGEYTSMYSANISFGWSGLALCGVRLIAVAFSTSSFIINISQVLTCMPSYYPKGYLLIEEEP
jgi:hypothetical protein